MKTPSNDLDTWASLKLSAVSGKLEHEAYDMPEGFTCGWLAGYKEAMEDLINFLALGN